METNEQKLIETIEGLKKDILELTCRLVREKSILGNEASVVQLMKGQLESLGFSPRIVPIQPEKLKDHPGFAQVPWDYTGRYNLVCQRPADGDGGKSALFNGHLDVVDPEPVHLWDTDPFQPVEREGRLYGRGTGDMKSGVAAMIYALYAIEKAGLGLKAPVTLETVIEEECCGNGALAVLDAGYTADAALIPEPFGPTILTHQVGVLWFKIIVEGKPVHVLEAPIGANAIEKMFPIIQALRKLEQAMNETEVPEAYREIDHPINLNTGIFNGGNWPSTVPARAELHGRLSFFPGVSYETVCDQIRSTVEKAVENDSWLKANQPQIEFYGFRSEGHGISRDTPALQTLNGCHQSLYGSDAETYIATCTTDLRVLHHFGNIPCTCYGPVGGNFHGANEWVDIKSIGDTAKSYALFLARWCGLME